MAIGLKVRVNNMWLAVLITVLVYSLIITIVDTIKDVSSYSNGLENWVDIVIAGPIMWVVIGIMAIIRPLYQKFHKEKQKEIKYYPEKQIQKTVAKVIRLYKKKYPNADVWLCPQYAYLIVGCEPVDEVEKPSKIELGTIRHELLERKYHNMCYNQPNEVWSALCEIGHPVTESKDWETFKNNTWKEYWERVEQAGCIEV